MDGGPRYIISRNNLILVTFFLVARTKKNICCFQNNTFFFSKAFGYGKLRVKFKKLWVNYG